jgi:hypothetical protein
MQYYNYTCLVALGKRVVNLQILDPGSPRRHGLEIPWTVVAPKQGHLIMGHTINQNSTNMYYECMDERGSDSENFGERITEFGVTVAKIWRKEVIGTYL